MAFNEILVGRLNRYVQKLLVIKNTALRSLAPDLVTTLSIQSGVEDRYLQGWARFAVAVNAPAVAAQFTNFELRNPGTSSIVAVIEFINLLVGAGENCAIQVFKNTGDQATIVHPTTSNLDSRQSSSNASCIASFGSQASAVSLTGAACIQIFGATGANTYPLAMADQELVLLPGDNLFIEGLLANTALSPSIIWRERPLESSETQ